MSIHVQVTHHTSFELRTTPSPTFYTRIHGYKMCLSADTNERYMRKATHVSVYMCMLHREYNGFTWWLFHRDNVYYKLFINIEYHYNIHP